MKILDIILIAIGLAMDCFAVSIACGIYIKKIFSWPTFRIALLFGVFQAFMPMIGWLIGTSFRSYIEKFDHWFAFIILFFLGSKMIYENFKRNDLNKKCLNPYRWAVALTMSIATSIDALAVGFTFSFLRMNLWFAIFIIGITSFILSLFGFFFGHHYYQRIKIPAELFGGIVLIGIGTKILLEHLYF